MAISKSTNSITGELIKAAKELNTAIKDLTFVPPVEAVYNPLEYAWKSFSMYVEKYGNSKKRVVLMGMNPGPWGMAQTGVPFGEIEAVRDWLKVKAPVGKPGKEHPKRPVEGFECPAVGSQRTALVGTV